VTRYLFRRLSSALVTLALLVTLVFFLLRLAPGGPFDEERAWPPAIKASIEHEYGLDQPLYRQYLTWLDHVAHGDFQDSFQYSGHSVNEILASGFPVSAELGVWAFFLSLVIGIPLGCVGAWKKGTWIDASATFAAVAGVSLPSYLVASLLILFFSTYLRWLPPALWDGPLTMILPIATLSFRPLAVIAKLTRASMTEALRSDYVRTARAKGAGAPAVVFKHALKNSMIPALTQLGPLAGSLITGSFIVELIFQLPGIGKHFVQAVLNRDYPIVMGVTLVYGVTLLTCNLASDLLYAAFDPRIRIEEERP
jgi:oligopeptide transport system permease protein